MPALFPNDVVTAGDFPIVVQHSSGGNGTFSGDGFVTFPFIDKFRKAIGGTFDANSDQNVGIKITFNNIGVNTDFKLISGEIVASYDADKWNKMLDADKLVEDIKNLVTSIKESFDKLDKLEEQKKTGAISNEEYIKDKEAIWNDIQKANNQYKELIKAKDLPDELKEKVAALTPPLPESVSNDNTAVKGNPESQKKEYLEKINELAKEVEDYKNQEKGIVLFINGKVGDDSERANSKYWSPELLSTVASQVGCNQVNFYFVDGDQGVLANTRIDAGVAKGIVDAKVIYLKLKKMRKDGLVKSQIRVITHSRGSAFGKGYMDGLTAEVFNLAQKENVKFSYNQDKLIKYSVNLAPHQSNSINYRSNSINVNVSHIGDPLSGNDATGNVININSIPEDDLFDQHGNGTYNTELNFIIEILEKNSLKSKVYDEIKLKYLLYDLQRKNGDKSEVTKG